MSATKPSDRTCVDALVHCRTLVNRQKMQLQDKDQDEIRNLDRIIGKLLDAEKELVAFFERKEMVFTGKVKYKSHGKDLWIGELEDGTKVHIRPANLGPGEKLIVTAGNIMVDSFGGSRRSPPFIRIVR